jgi:hypothetical protein
MSLGKVEKAGRRDVFFEQPFKVPIEIPALLLDRDIRPSPAQEGEVRAHWVFPLQRQTFKDLLTSALFKQSFACPACCSKKSGE